MAIASAFGIAVAATMLLWFGAATTSPRGSAEAALLVIDQHAVQIEDQINRLRSLFSGYEQDNAGIAYFVLCAFFVFGAIMKASRFHVVILSGYGICSEKLRRANPLLFRFLFWYLAGALLILATFTILQFYLVHRYALLTSIILNILLALILPKLYTEWKAADRKSRLKAWLFPIIITIFVFDWVTEIPKPTRITDLREAGEWIAEHAGDDHVVSSNDARIIYYAGEPFSAERLRFEVAVFPVTGNPATDWKGNDIVAIAVVGPDTENTIRQSFDLEPAKVVTGRRGRRVLIYDLKR